MWFIGGVLLPAVNTKTLFGLYWGYYYAFFYKLHNDQKNITEIPFHNVFDRQAVSCCLWGSPAQISYETSWRYQVASSQDTEQVGEAGEKNPGGNVIWYTTKPPEDIFWTSNLKIIPLPGMYMLYMCRKKNCQTRFQNAAWNLTENFGLYVFESQFLVLLVGGRQAWTYLDKSQKWGWIR